MNKNETLLRETIDSIRPAAHDLSRKAAERLDTVMEGDSASLGRLTEPLLRYLAIAGSLHPEKLEPCTMIFCADHGVAAEGVSAYPKETTLHMTRNYLISRGAAANAMANFLESELMVIDMGLSVHESIPGLIDRHIADGTKNIAEGPAMTREEALQALATGIELAGRAADAGFTCILPGEMGIANTTSSACLAAVFCGLTAEEATGRGTNISDERLQKKIGIVKKALTINTINKEDGIDVLAKVGGFEFGAMAGLILGAAARKIAVILDGANTAAAALIAQSLSPASIDYVLASHIGGEKSHAHALKKLGLRPLLSLDLKLSEACGSSLLMAFLDDMLKAWEVLDRGPQDSIETKFQQEYMPETARPVTDKTFDFYLNTMQDLDHESMARCESRLNTLAKPIYSMGALESIVIELAGIIGTELPTLDEGRALLCFTGHKTSQLQSQLTAAFADTYSVEVTMAHIQEMENLPPTAAFDFGREQAEILSLSTPLLGISMTELYPETPFGTAEKELREALLNPDGSLRYGAEEFLAKTPLPYQSMVSAILGAIIAAAHNSSLVLIGDTATDIIARYTEKLAPAVRPYLLHLQPSLLKTNLTAGGGILALLGFELTMASLHIANDMKTFADTRVAVANDGAGKGKQISC